ncbi:monocarboxylate transporter 9-like [Haliotis rufescens]|uniref:monocarboxylate transporter 9-like n=1 Tax=Haliotis rufescens TaxID=6454 RepID=UPI00201EA13F|nr:monocarboxylate transporter 9-like [Haliotis rufescens]
MSEENFKKPQDTKEDDTELHAQHLLSKNGQTSEESDSGLGWVIVFASFFSHAMFFGINLSFGVIYVFLLEYFDMNRGDTAWIGSIPTGLLSMVGIGLGLMLLPSKVVVNQYMKKRRALANGICASGSGAGTIAFSAMFRALRTAYGLSGMFLISGAVVLNAAVCGYLYRPKKQRKRALSPAPGGIWTGLKTVALVGVVGLENLSKALGLMMFLQGLSGFISSPLAAPVAGILTDKYDCRAVTISGAVIASSGFVISSFATSIDYLYISYGVLVGIGLGLMFLPSKVIVNQYMKKRRALANGICSSGSGAGTMAFSAMFQALRTAYGLSGMFLISGAIVLNAAVCGYLYRPKKQRQKALSPAPEGVIQFSD